MKHIALVCLLCLIATAAFAEGPRVSYGPPGDPVNLPDREDVCQYGYVDMQPGQGWSLYAGQQLGILCFAPGSISAVGFYVEFVSVPGNLDIVIYDGGTEVSRTSVTPTTGDNEFDIDDVAIAGDACIMLCPTSFDGVTGEDINSAPYGNCFWSASCQCSNPFTDNNLTIWAVTGAPVATEQQSWGALRMLYR
ncbi:MAG: hypothetical protein ACE15D_03745 [Candidatus Eisenbacteria bacterium]|nr:hypothetical protein [Candidatus Eisenbacteria bacterium]